MQGGHPSGVLPAHLSKSNKYQKKQNLRPTIREAPVKVFSAITVTLIFLFFTGCGSSATDENARMILGDWSGERGDFYFANDGKGQVTKDDGTVVNFTYELSSNIVAFDYIETGKSAEAEYSFPDTDSLRLQVKGAPASLGFTMTKIE